MKILLDIDGQDTTSGFVGRLSPTQESAADPKFPNALYAPGPGHKRDKYVENVIALGITLNPFFSHQNIIKRSQNLEDNARKLEEVFEATPALNLSGVHFGYQPRENVNSFLHPVKFNLYFSWVRDLIRKLPSGIEQRFVPSGISCMIRFRTGIRQEVQKLLSSNDNDALNAAGSRGVSSIFIELRNSQKLPASEKSAQRLEDEATLLVMAATQSTQSSLTLHHYYSLANPTTMAKL
ncbi:hypothetical protein EKO27_g7006 [Xylaria grammica]|uniref:Uncharacterized protein n=1 Tax=Xylaria grammica TaxID=363999 RepID=A0A439D1H3_9PEZI|nr:hypothetical protein EKO27_g7006 [Xylaria grammica]